jgi:hypothetical protein
LPCIAPGSATTPPPPAANAELALKGEIIKAKANEEAIRIGVDLIFTKSSKNMISETP